MQNKNVLQEEEYKQLKKNLKKYINLFKAVYLFDPSLAAEFKRKNEQCHNTSHKEKMHGSCCANKIDTKIYIPKDKMNNIEKNLSEIYSTLFYESNLNDMLTFLSEKFEKITKSGIKDGLILDKDSEKDLLHRLLLEGIPYFIFEKLKLKLKQYEESISEQPMLLAHPSGVQNQKLINLIEPNYIKQLVENNYITIKEKIYDTM